MSTVLVVDDMAVFREPISGMLRQAGYQTITAMNGREALALTRRSRPDLVLLDVTMPVMDGLAYLRELRADPRLRETPVILLTAVADRNAVTQAAQLGVRDYLLKTKFRSDEMFARIEKYLGEPTRGAVATAVPRKTGAEALPPPSGQGPSAAEHQGPLDDVQTIKDLKPVLTRSEVTDRLDNCGELKGLSPTVTRVLEMTRQANCSVERLARAIKQDQAIALKILKLANSSVYTRGEPVDSVQTAVVRIGMSEIRQAVTNIGVIGRFSGDAHACHLRVPQFWEHSIACGLIATELARSLGARDAQVDAAFTMGLLHDVGRMMYLEMFGDQYAGVFQAAEHLRLPVEQIESRMFLINHADAMDRLLRSWGFPLDLINPIALHHLSMGNIRRLAPHSVSEVATLALANRLAHALLLGSSGNLTLYAIEEYVDALKVPGDVIARIVEKVPGETDDIKFAMLSRSQDTAWGRTVDDVQAQMPSPLHAICISARQDINTYRIFCDQLRRGADDDPPNLGVVYMTHVRERDALSAQLESAERKAETQALPLIVLSPNGNIALSERIMEGRQTVLLPVPVTVGRFVEAANNLVGPAEQTQDHKSAA